MTEKGSKWGVWAAALAAVLLVLLIDLVTNSIDTGKFSWDFRYYIAMAEGGLADPLVSPFAYRYLTPLLSGGLARALGLPVDAGFAVVAYMGAIAQLWSVFLFARWYTGSQRGAWLAMLAVAFSLFNVKFLLFDRYRPDHLAYPLIVLQTYFAMTGRFRWLLLSTIIGCQIREFNAIPLVAFELTRLRRRDAPLAPSDRLKIAAEVIVAAIGLGAAVILPRVLIPVSADFQFAALTPEGLLRSLLAPLILARDANFLFSIAAYCLPVLMLAGPGQLREAMKDLAPQDKSFLGAYTALVLALSFLGGTDFFRFSTFLLLPQAVVLARLANRAPLWRMGVVLTSVFLFNRMWLPFPMSDLDAYLDFYGAYGTRFNVASILRVLELAGFMAIGVLSRLWSGKLSRPHSAAGP